MPLAVRDLPRAGEVTGGLLSILPALLRKAIGAEFDAIKAYLEGDERPLWALAEEWLGQPPAAHPSALPKRVRIGRNAQLSAGLGDS